ncbi:uncharacterized protein LOC130690308 [Daphnia carinata]|uniref:uncharacterized protein LOC130690308 n=1 Tax=Daphnia carinata TaxID=120202 RepID=UPI002580C9E5|nr:uncharacterized protein LOC130690308 [Daphnia carinata]
MGRQRKCVVQGCHRDKEIAIKTFCIPKIRKSDEAITTRRQNLWLRRLKLSSKNQSIHDMRVCEAHFLSGKPSYYLDEKNPDWAPSQNMGSINFVSKCAYERYKRRKKIETMRAETTEWLLKGKVIRQINHQPLAVSSSSTHASLHKNAFSSKVLEVVKKKITHQMPGGVKKQEKLPGICKDDQLDISWTHTPPIENFSEVCVGEIVILGETHPSSVAQSLKPTNDKEQGAPGKSVENEKNGGSPEQMVRNKRIFFISSNTTHDHDYCAKSICISDSPQSALDHRSSPIDHDYCRMLLPYGTPAAAENDSNSPHIPSQTNTSNKSSQEGTDVFEDKIVGIKSGLESHSTIDIFCEFILPDIAIDDNDSICNRCSEDVSHLQLVLEQKSTILEDRLKDLDSVKQELERAKEHINNLRAQLEENTNTLCSYFSVDGKPS